MSDYAPEYGRRVAVDLDFETTLGALSRAVRDEGLHTLARIDVRDHFMKDERHVFGLYEIIEAWSPDLATATLDRHPDAGLVLPTRFVIRAVTGRQTVVLASEPLQPMASNAQWREDYPDLAALADRESARVARVLQAVEHQARTPRADASAATTSSSLT